jgi:hypothetical protein
MNPSTERAKLERTDARKDVGRQESRSRERPALGVEFQWGDPGSLFDLLSSPHNLLCEPRFGLRNCLDQSCDHLIGVDLL